MTTKPQGKKPNFTLSSGAMSVVSNQVDALSVVLDYDAPFEMQKLKDEIGPSVTAKARTMGILYIVRREYDGGMSNVTQYWDIHPRAREYIAKSANRPTLPCGHRWGIVDNIDGDGYQCPADHCDETYDRETVADFAP